MRRYFPLVLVAAWSATTAVCTAQPASDEKVIADFYWRTGHYQSAMFYVQLQEAREKQKPEVKKEPGKPASLEQLIAESLKNNPDIRVAEAKSREVNAQLDRVRLKVASEVAILHADIDAAKAGLFEAETRYQRAYNLYYANPKVISSEDFGTAKMTMLKMKSELAAAEAKLPFLLGRSAGSVDFTSEKLFDAHKAGLETAQAQMKRQMDDEFARFWAARNLADQADTPLRVNLRKALDAPVQLDATNLAAKEAVAVVANKLPVVNVVIRVKNFNKKGLDLKLKEPVPLGAALQYVEDELGIVFILRDYGIVVVGADELMPPGAVRVVDFWKHGKAAVTKAESKDTK